MDYIHVKDMEFWGNHGVFPEETRLGQRFRLSVSLALSLKEAGELDDLNKSVNYGDVFMRCERIMEGSPVKLLETLAETVANDLLTTYKGLVEGCRVEVIKPDPPIPGHYKEVSVEITRGRFS
ncbi:dihydroneopterin aldolase [Paenisporosarcina cavernae]|uniref:7,8-dihydroneopterin aldolase n=1 Tax=Paenisporosarcina cavernae TaxID=2320858 RepID=A0A385YYM5_9BACL|nr:dihydroneopterin aldolase [Paenisporosarcina cavernae]AYC30673.1 dihydroneopterin aldolase [Paenisporosarcina cavernae]